MKPLSDFRIKHFAVLILTACFFLCTHSSRAQCYVNVYSTSTGPLCYPQRAGLEASYNNGTGEAVYGYFTWYTSETDPNPVQTEWVTNDDGETVTSDYGLYAADGTTMWVSFYNYNNGCQTDRASYTFTITPTPSLNIDYARVCHTDFPKIQLSSNTSGIYFDLYKMIDGNYQIVQENTSGYFDVNDYDYLNDRDSYAVSFRQPYGCSTGSLIPITFEITDIFPPNVTGNFSVLQGSSTTLIAGGAYDYRWYDAAGNFLSEGATFSTPTTLTDNTYTYQIRGVSSDGNCLTNPGYITIAVNLPGISYSSLYNSSNFSKSVDLSKPVGTIGGVAAASPSGAVTYSIPIYTPPGTGGTHPMVSLDYNSQAPNGIAGYGWNISGLSAVSRNGKDIYHNGVVTPVAFTSDDAFTLDGSRLNPISGSNGANGTVYAAEAESFSRIVSNGGSPNNPDWFQVTTKDGTVMEYGNSSDSRIITDDGASVMLWRLNKVKDVNGNYIVFHYDNGYRDSRIDEIDYTGNANTGLLPYNSIKFNYDVRSDIATTYMAGASSISKHILNSITIKSEGNLVKTYQLNYGFDNMYSLLKEVIESGSDGTALNSTIFLYGDAPSGFVTESSAVVAGSAVDVYTGDFNGDGISDILAASYQYSNFIKYNTDYTIYTRTSQNSSFQPLYTVPLSTSWQVINSKQVPFGRNFISSDFDGDGRDDILLTNSHIQNSSSGTRRIDGIQINFSKDQGYNTVGYPFPVTSDIFNGNQTCTLFDPPGNYIIPGDFDGDGASDFITIFRPDGSGTYHCFLTCPRAGITNAEIASSVNISPGTISTANNIQPVDFDGDGKMELMVTNGSTTYIISISPYNSAFVMSTIYTSSSINSNCQIWPGDFNGDRKTDLLVRNASSGWYILYANGKSFVQQNFGFNQSVNISNDKILVADFNGDGKSDILHGYDYFVNGVASTSKLSVYYSRGNPSLGFNYEQTDYNNVLGLTPLIVADLNGDGRNDFINRNYYGDPFDILYLKPNGKERLLAKVTDGFNATTSFNYNTLTDKTTYPVVYNRTISLDNAANQYPFNYSQPPLYVVSSVASPNGIGGTNTTTYNYEDAVINRAGKGFLGFNKVTSKDVAKNITSVTQSQVNTTFAVSYPVTETRQLTSSGEILSQASINTSFISLSTGANDPKRFVQHIDKVLSTDNLSGAASENSYSYDNYGNVTTSVTKTGAPSGSTVDPTETVTTTTSYGIYNTPVPARADNITVSKVRIGMPVQNTTTVYTYNGIGLPATEVLYSGQPKAVTTTYTYDGFGNATQVTMSAAGMTSRTTTNTYDSYGRFALTKQAGSGATAQTESFTYDGKWGKPLTHASTDCLNSSFEYDGFGRLKTTHTPAGYAITTTLNWDVSGDVVYYDYTNMPGGNPSTKIWYDKLGRAVKKQTAGFNNQWLTQLTTYDAKGNVATATNNYYSGETPLTTTNSYDGYNRPYVVSNSLNSNTYSYTTLGAGKLQITTQNAAGQTSSKVSDATGKVVSAIDNGGQVDFTYNSNGQQTQVVHGGITLVTMDYDPYGRQIALNDKNAGNITYEFDAFGQLKQQTDNNGNTYNMGYDDLGRLISRQGPEGTSTFEYFKDNSTGCSNNNLAKVTSFSGVVKEYTYDNLRRLQSEKVTIDGTANTTQYGYNTYGNLTSITYPSGVVVNNNYNGNGQLTSVTGGDPGAQTTLFTGTQMNGFGEYTGYTLGNNRAGTNTYNFGIPTRFYTPGIQDLNLTYDYTKGTLLSRQDAVKGITENFQYDNLNRLTQTSVNNQVQINTGYDNNAGHSWGNIISKTDAGNYVYKNDKVHAVAYITNPAGTTNPPVTISTTDQVISYTPFLKTASIAQGTSQLNYTYGADYERAKSILQQNGSTIETKYYFGDYERQITSGGVTTDIHIVKGGNGTCAVIVRQNGVNSFYVAYIDHLRSVLTLTDLNGNVIAEQNYDAWGRNRNPQNWTYGSIPSVPSWLYRGYTGHEHLPQFGLVNMNGRIYDPIEGRMLSPDNYVSDPYNTQGYNRYAYAMNNPLVNSDPSGDIIFTILAAIFCPPLIPLGIAMDVGSIVNTMSNLDHIHNFWDGLKYYGAGAGGGAATYLWGPVAGFAIGGALNIGADATVKNPETGKNYLSDKSDFGDFLKSGITGGLSALSGGEAGISYSDKAPSTFFEKLLKDDGFKYLKYTYQGVKSVLGAYAQGNFDGKHFGTILGGIGENFAGGFGSGYLQDVITPDYDGKGTMNGQKIFDKHLPYFTSKFLGSILGNGISNFISTGYVPSLFPIYSDPTKNYRLNYGNLSSSAGDIFSGLALYFKSFK